MQIYFLVILLITLVTADMSSMRNLIGRLKGTKFYKSPRVEEVLLATDRGIYYPSVGAYQDTPMTIGHGQTISAPHMHATALELLNENLKTGAKVLDVGVGSGYLAGAFARMVGPSGTVVGIDVVKPLVERAKVALKEDGFEEMMESGNMVIEYGDGWAGYPDKAPFDAIHVGAAAETLPQALVDQLAPGGRMVCPVGPDGGHQEFLLVEKHADGTVTTESVFGVRYVPLVKTDL